MFPFTATNRSRVEARVCGLVAEHLGVDVEELRREVSLVEDLAADSLDLLEIGLAIEGALGVVLPRRVLDEVRTCGDLVDATLTLTEREAPRPVILRARITSAEDRAGWTIERALPLTPYAEETIAEDALGAGPGGRLELEVTGASDGRPDRNVDPKRDVSASIRPHILCSERAKRAGVGAPAGFA
jgi:acyl carrier protein